METRTQRPLIKTVTKGSRRGGATRTGILPGPSAITGARKVAINPDRSWARFVGTTSDGRQFFAQPCCTDLLESRQHSEFLALYLFGASGNLLEARIEEVTSRQGNDEEWTTLQKMVDQLGEVTFERIEVKPFTVERFGLQFGLIVQKPIRQERKRGEDWSWIALQTGESMTFQEPFDSGFYDT